jgi:hydroxymethylpyrimidine pyrophosphatase-like HAD family hydrolase
MGRIKLLAVDLDGTLLTETKEISPATRCWINRTIERGVIVVFATGRGFVNTEPYRRQLGLDIPMALVNGAEIWIRPGELLEPRRFISGDGALRLYRLATENGAWFWGYTEDRLVHLEEWTEEEFSCGWLKLGIRHDDLPVMERLRQTVINWGTYEVSRSAPVNMEVSALGVTKLDAVGKICKHFGIHISEVMAVGDSHNDLKLIKAAGLGVAMANAEPIVKEHADVITSSNDEDGVAEAIRRYIFQE